MDETDVEDYLERRGFDVNKFIKEVKRVKIPIASEIGKVRSWNCEDGWVLKRLEDKEYLRDINMRRFGVSIVLMAWDKKRESWECIPSYHHSIPGNDFVFQNKKRYLIYNLRLCSIFYGLKKMIKGGTFVYTSDRKRKPLE